MTTSMKEMNSKWRRTLYEKTGLPDNYTPEDCFLDAIQKNRDLQRHSFQKCTQVASRPAMQFSVTILFIVIYNILSSDKNPLLSPLLSVILGLPIAGCLLHRIQSNSFPGAMWADFKHIVVFLCFGLGLSPVLYKLTDTISTDTIHTTSGAMLGLHLISHDYSSTENFRTNALSLNAALFAAVCLASRLNSTPHAFFLLAMSVNVFVVFPLIRSLLKDDLALIINILLGLGVVLLALVMNLFGFALATLLVLTFITFIAPWLFVRWQSYKDTIHGPWDEAVPKI